MKKIISAFLVFALLIPLSACAEEATLDSLAKRRDELLQELAQVNAERAKILKEKTTIASEDNRKIKEIFPDPALAAAVRDACTKFSIEQTVTQKELSQIDTLSIRNVVGGYGKVEDFTGIGYLDHLEYIYADYCGVTSLPDEMQNCALLHSLNLSHSSLETLPNWIGNFTGLYTLDISSTKVAELPETVGNLKNLKVLSIGRTNITALPESIYNLELTYLNMEGLPIQ